MNTDRIKRHLSLDLGPTILAGQLLSPAGDVLTMALVANPQRAKGTDIPSRLHLIQAGEGRVLQQLLIEGLRSLVDQLLGKVGFTRGDITSTWYVADRYWD